MWCARSLLVYEREVLFIVRVSVDIFFDALCCLCCSRHPVNSQQIIHSRINAYRRKFIRANSSSVKFKVQIIHSSSLAAAHHRHHHQRQKIKTRRHSKHFSVRPSSSSSNRRKRLRERERLRAIKSD